MTTTRSAKSRPATFSDLLNAHVGELIEFGYSTGYGIGKGIVLYATSDYLAFREPSGREAFIPLAHLVQTSFST